MLKVLAGLVSCEASLACRPTSCYALTWPFSLCAPTRGISSSSGEGLQLYRIKTSPI